MSERFFVKKTNPRAVFFPVNEMMKEQIAASKQIKLADLSLPDRLIAGATAGLCYWVGTCPLDVIKSQMMVHRYANYKQNWWQTVKIMYKEGGLARFYVGVTASAARSIPACSTMFAGERAKPASIDEDSSDESREMWLQKYIHY